MIIKIEEGNLLTEFRKDRFLAIVHGCNCFNTMGAGIAAQIARDYPDALKADEQTIEGDRSKLGNLTLCITQHGIIFNAYTQFTFWDMNDMLYYEAVYECFKRINDYYTETWKSTRSYVRPDMARPLIGIPKIGCGLAGGDWETVSKCIDEATPDIDVIVLDLPPGSKMATKRKKKTVSTYS